MELGQTPTERLELLDLVLEHLPILHRLGLPCSRSAWAVWRTLVSRANSSEVRDKRMLRRYAHRRARLKPGKPNDLRT
jgi:hypothetical protein